MDIQWVIFAQAWQVAEDGTIDIAGVFGELGAVAPDYKATFVVLAKVKEQPTEVGNTKTLRVEICRRGERLLDFKEWPYQVPDLKTWAKATPFIHLPVNDYPFKELGDYSFDFYVDGEFKNREWLIIKDAEVIKNERTDIKRNG